MKKMFSVLTLNCFLFSLYSLSGCSQIPTNAMNSAGFPAAAPTATPVAGAGSALINIDPAVAAYLNMETGSLSAAAVPGFSVQLTTDSLNFICNTAANAQNYGWISDFGSVTGLSSVNVIPTTGRVPSLAAIPSNGYVVQLSDGTYARFYVQAPLVTAAGVLFGYTINWQYPFTAY